jgi:hypothetical protein
MDVRSLYFDTILVLTASKKQEVKWLRYSHVADFKVLVKFISHL